MKKSLVALAALAATTVFAQSSVTLYGVADAWVGSSKVDNTLDANNNLISGQRQTVVGSGGINGSRWGLRGSEDLGGGLKANFVLEQGFTIDNAAAVNGALQFSRQAFVGVSGGFGEVRLGRQYSAYDELRAATNNTNDTSFATTGTVWGVASGADYNSRVDNQIYYSSANYGGISGAIGYGLGENKTATTKATNTLSLHVKYANGPILVGLAHQDEKLADAGVGSNKYTLIAGSYDFGVAKLTAGFNNAKRPQSATTSEKDTEFQLGVSLPLGAAAVHAGFTSAKVTTSPATVTTKASGFSLLGTYDLSKRTAVYGGLNTTKGKDGSVNVYKSQLLAVGVRHRF